MGLYLIQVGLIKLMTCGFGILAQLSILHKAFNEWGQFQFLVFITLNVLVSSINVYPSNQINDNVDRYFCTNSTFAQLCFFA